MARVEISEVVLSSTGVPVANASVQVNVRAGGSATVYSTEGGGGTVSNPITTDDNGRIEGWVVEGSYDLVVSGTGFTTYTQYFEATRGTSSAGTVLTTAGDILYASAANTPARVAIGSAGQFLRVSSGIPAWQTVGGYGTALPGSPADGDEYTLVDSTSAPTYAWRLRYNSTAAKWDFLGGSPIHAEVTTAETTASTSYVALATAGPSIVLPVAGDYIVETGFTGSSATAAGVARMSYDIGGTGAVDADATLGDFTAAVQQYSLTRRRKKTGLTAVTLTAKYKVSANTLGFQSRWMSVLPIKVG